ncbi:MAG: hypothetical protein HN348_03970, partial [Proteobacteria bacterium]|nr:hypothetical protein [Pseudomonadota bacterium]
MNYLVNNNVFSSIFNGFAIMALVVQVAFGAGFVSKALASVLAGQITLFSNLSLLAMGL